MKKLFFILLTMIMIVSCSKHSVIELTTLIDNTVWVYDNNSQGGDHYELISFHGNGNCNYYYHLYDEVLDLDMKFKVADQDITLFYGDQNSIRGVIKQDIIELSGLTGRIRVYKKIR